jgi:hypothetical protein
MAVVSSRTVPAGDLVPDSHAPPGRVLDEDLAGLDDQALLGIAGSLPPGSERRATAYGLLVTRYRWLVRSCVRPYLHSPEPAEDLMQVGTSAC